MIYTLDESSLSFMKGNTAMDFLDSFTSTVVVSRFKDLFKQSGTVEQYQSYQYNKKPIEEITPALFFFAVDFELLSVLTFSLPLI